MLKGDAIKSELTKMMFTQLEVCYANEDVEGFKSRLAIIQTLVELNAETLKGFYACNDEKKSIKVMFNFLKKFYPDLFEEQEKSKQMRKTSQIYS